MSNYLPRYTRIDYHFVLRTALISRKAKDTIRLPDICFLGNETYRSPIAPSGVQAYKASEISVSGTRKRSGASPPNGRCISIWPNRFAAQHSIIALTRHLPGLCQILPNTPISYVHPFHESMTGITPDQRASGRLRGLSALHLLCSNVLPYALEIRK